MSIFLKSKQTSLIIEHNYTTKQLYSFLHVQHLLTFLAKPFVISLTKHLKQIEKSTLLFLILLEVGQPKINVLIALEPDENSCSKGIHTMCSHIGSTTGLLL